MRGLPREGSKRYSRTCPLGKVRGKCANMQTRRSLFRPKLLTANRATIRRTTADTRTKPKRFLDFHFLLISLLIYECFLHFLHIPMLVRVYR